MTGTRLIKDPTLNCGKFDRGDFIQCQIHNHYLSLGIVDSASDESVEFVCFDYGFPHRSSTLPKFGLAKKLSKDEAIAEFAKLAQRFEQEIDFKDPSKDLTSAIFARRQHFLEGMIPEIESCQDKYLLSSVYPPEPMTGVYVIMGFSIMGQSNCLDSLAVSPRLPERSVDSILWSLYPNGFGNIPKEIYHAKATPRSSLVSYRSFEVPKKALDLIKNPKKLELILPQEIH